MHFILRICLSNNFSTNFTSTTLSPPTFTTRCFWSQQEMKSNISFNEFSFLKLFTQRITNAVITEVNSTSISVWDKNRINNKNFRIRSKLVPRRNVKLDLLLFPLQWRESRVSLRDDGMWLKNNLLSMTWLQLAAIDAWNHAASWVISEQVSVRDHNDVWQGVSKNI
jgi:hypothetical protein